MRDLRNPGCFLCVTSLLLAGVVVAGLGCRVDDLNHCANRTDAQERTEDAWCLAAHGLAYCDRCQRSAERDGCTDVRPTDAECSSDPLEGASGGSSGMETGPVSPCTIEGPSDECTALDPLASFCREGQCVACDDALCSDGVCDPRPAAECVPCRPDAEAGCPAEAPWCGDDLACSTRCTRHEQCPASACERSTGTCIPPEGAVAWVDLDLEPAAEPSGPSQCRSTTGADWSVPVTYCSLQLALDDAPDMAVIRLRGSHASSPWMLEHASVPGTNRVLVLMADPEGERVTLSAPGTNDPLILGTVFRTHLYLHRLVLDGVGEHSHAIGIDCVGEENLPTQLWLDEVEMQGLAMGIRAHECSVQLTRSTVHGSSVDDDLPGSGIGIDVRGRSVRLESSVIALNEGPGLRVEAAEAQLSFSSLLGNGDALGFPANVVCEGAVEGEITGSLLLQPQVSGTTVLCTEEALSLDGRTLTQLSLEGSSPYELTDLFSNVLTGELRDPATNPIAAFQGASWQPGDPYFDVDGQPRAHQDRLYVTPGANEP